MIVDGERLSGPYVTDGVQDDFTFDFKVFASSDLVVLVGEDILALTTDYTVVLNGDQDNNPGGTVTLLTPEDYDGPDLFIDGSAMPYTQPNQFTNTGGFYPSVLNAALDRLTILIQQGRDANARSLKVPVGSDVLEIGDVSDIAQGDVLAWIDGKLVPVPYEPAAAELTAAYAAEVAASTLIVETDTALVQSLHDETEDYRDEVLGYHDTFIAAVIASLVNTPAAADYTAGLAAVADGESFYLVYDDRRWYYIRVSSTIGDLIAITPNDTVRGDYAQLRASGDIETGMSGLTVDYFCADTLYSPGAIRNRANGMPSLNLLASNRPSDGGVWDGLQAFGPALTRNRTGLIAGSYAMRLVDAGTAGHVVNFNVLMPPGRWSLVLTQKSNSGTPDFRVSLDGGTTKAVVTSTGAATRKVCQTLVSTTFNVRAVQVVGMAAVPAALDLEIDDIYIIPGDGSSVPGQVLGIQPTGDLPRVPSGLLADSGAVRASSALHMLAPLGAPITLTSYSISIAAKRTGTIGANTLWSFIGDALHYCQDTALQQCLSVLGATGGGALRSLPLADTYTVLGFVHTSGVSGTLRVYVDGRMVDEIASPLTAVTNVRTMSLFGRDTATSDNFVGEGVSVRAKVNYVATHAEMWGEAQIARARILAAGGTYLASEVVPFWEGNSIPYGTLADVTYSSIIAASYAPYLGGGNHAVPGDTITNVANRFDSKLLPMLRAEKRAGRLPVLHLFVGTNELAAAGSSANVTTKVAAVQAYRDRVMAEGVPIFISTACADTGLNASQETWRTTIYNPGILALASAQGCYITDLAIVAGLAVNDGTNYADAKHFNNAGHVLAAAAIKTVMDPVLAKLL